MCAPHPIDARSAARRRQRDEKEFAEIRDRSGAGRLLSMVRHLADVLAPAAGLDDLAVPSKVEHHALRNLSAGIWSGAGPRNAAGPRAAISESVRARLWVLVSGLRAGDGTSPSRCDPVVVRASRYRRATVVVGVAAIENPQAMQRGSMPTVRLRSARLSSSMPGVRRSPFQDSKSAML
jgi:hypothetical protein